MSNPAAKDRKYYTPMPNNTILNQGRRRQCTMFATAGNANEHLNGVSLDHDQIMALWHELMGPDAENKGTDPRVVINFCIRKGIFKEWEYVYDHKMQKLKEKYIIERIRKAYESENETVLFTVQCYDIKTGPHKGKKLPVDERGILLKVQDDWAEEGTHLVHSGGYFHPEKFYATHWDIENSWGQEFGDKGHCGIPIGRMLEYVRSVFIVKI